MSHLSAEVLIDVAEGARPESSEPHLAVCTACRAQLADLREMMATTVAVEAPEPSPLFWDHLSARVREATAAEPAGSTSWWRFGRRPWTFAGAVSVALIIVAVSVTMRMPVGKGSDAPGIVTPAAMANEGIAAIADDPSLSLLADLADGMDWDEAVDAGMTMEVGAVEDALSELSDAERVELQRLLREAMAGSGA